MRVESGEQCENEDESGVQSESGEAWRGKRVSLIDLWKF